ncbi:MAG: HAMP domain-containing sensor histidine kinase [Anaeromyxobacter sp.]
MSRPLAPLALRIWGVTVASVLVSVTGVFATLHLVAPPPGGPPPGGGPYVVRNLASMARDPVALEGEVGRVEREAGMLASVHRWDGARVAGRDAPPLTPRELAMLARTGRAHVGGEACFPGPCPEAFRLGPPEAPTGYVVLSPVEHRAMGGLLPLVLTVLGLTVASGLLGAYLAGPLRRLAAAARAFGAGDLTARSGLRRRDELGEVGQAFDEMADRLVTTLRGQTELVANVAHELRTPLARIRVALDLAEEGDAAVARASLVDISQDLSELEGLVADVLASARLELAAAAPPASAGTPPLRMERLDLTALLRDAADRLRQRHPDREVVVEVPDALPAVEADRVMLRRAVENLLDNARKYSPAPEPIRLAARAGAGGVEVAVTDRGAGIAPEDLPHLFTPFFRADRSRTRATGGVGLGLSLSRRIAEAHRGSLTVESAPGAGSTFTLVLPAAR